MPVTSGGQNPLHLNPLNLKDPKIRTLHFTWVAFFISFFVWFNHAPFMATIREAFGLSDQQVVTLLILNVALTHATVSPCLVSNWMQP